jgi:hypothetical protein
MILTLFISENTKEGEHIETAQQCINYNYSKVDKIIQKKLIAIFLLYIIFIGNYMSSFSYFMYISICFL